MQVSQKLIFGEGIVIRVRADAQADVVLRDAIRDETIAVTLIEGQADRVPANLISLSRLRSDD